MSPPRADPLTGIVSMLLAMAILPFLDVIAKHLGGLGVPVLQIVWARLFIGTLVTLPFALKLAGPKGLIPNMPFMHGIRAGFQAVNPGVFLALASGMSLAIYMLLTKRITGSAPAMVTTFYTSLMGAIIMCAAVPFVWQPVTPAHWGFFVLLALIANGGHYLVVKAYDHAEASLLAPLAYTEMIMVVAAGWYFFGDFPGL